MTGQNLKIVEGVSDGGSIGQEADAPDGAAEISSRSAHCLGQPAVIGFTGCSVPFAGSDDNAWVGESGAPVSSHWANMMP